MSCFSPPYSGNFWKTWEFWESAQNLATLNITLIYLIVWLGQCISNGGLGPTISGPFEIVTWDLWCVEIHFSAMENKLSYEGLNNMMCFTVSHMAYKPNDTPYA